MQSGSGSVFEVPCHINPNLTGSITCNLSFAGASMQVQDTGELQSEMIQTLSSSLQDLHSKADGLTDVVKNIQDMLMAAQQQQQTLSEFAPGMPQTGGTLPTASADMAPDTEPHREHDRPPQVQAGGWRTKRGAKPTAHAQTQHQTHAVAEKQSQRPASAIAPALALPPQPSGKECTASFWSNTAASDDVPRHTAARPAVQQPLQPRSPRVDEAAGCAARIRMASAPAQSGGGSSVPAGRVVFGEVPTHAAGQVATPKQACQGATAGDKPATGARAEAAAKPTNSCQTAASGARGNLDGWLTPVRKRNRTADANSSKVFRLGAKVRVPWAAVTRCHPDVTWGLH